MTTTRPTGPAWPARVRRSIPSAGLSGAAVISIAIAVLAAYGAMGVHNFATSDNLRGLCLSVSLIGIIAEGLSLIAIVGRVFTLSIPALVALSTIVFAKTLEAGWLPALLASVAVATVAGAVQGLIVGRLDTDPIVTTIAASAIMIGIGQLWTHGRTIIGRGNPKFLNSNLFHFIPLQTAVFVLVGAALFAVHKYTVVGRKTALVGLNERAARVAGLRSWPFIALAFTVSGATTGLAASLLSAQSGQGTLQLGASFGFDAIVAVVVGGVSITGGVGSPIGAAVGAIFVGLVENILQLLGYSYGVQLVVKGALVLAAVTAMGLAERRPR